MENQTIARWTFISGVAFVFIYFGIDKFVHPKTWEYWMPAVFNGLLGQNTLFWLHVTGIAEIVMGVMVMVPMRFIQKLGALFASIHLVVVLTQVGWNDIAVRDTGLLCLTMGLWYLL